MLTSMIMALVLIAISGVLICIGVFLLPIGGAPAAMGTATGVATGAEMMAAGSGLTGLLMACALYNEPAWVVMVNAGISSSIMMTVLMLSANVIYMLGRGIPPALATVEIDPVTKENNKPFITPGTVGHGVPTGGYVSGIFGSFVGGVGGALTFIPMYRFSSGIFDLLGSLPQTRPDLSAISLACITALGIYFINANIAAYSIKGVIEGWWDPKFKQIGRVATVCFIASFLFGIMVLLASVPL